MTILARLVAALAIGTAVSTFSTLKLHDPMIGLSLFCALAGTLGGEFAIRKLRHQAIKADDPEQGHVEVPAVNDQS